MSIKSASALFAQKIYQVFNLILIDYKNMKFYPCLWW